MKVISVGLLVFISTASFAMQQDPPEVQEPEVLAVASALLRRRSGSLPCIESNGSLKTVGDQAAEGAAHTGKLRLRSVSGSSDNGRLLTCRSTSTEIDVPVVPEDDQ